MGKKRIAVVGEKATAKEKDQKKERKIVKTGKEHGRITDVGAETLAEAETIKAKTEKLVKDLAKKSEKAKTKKKRPTRQRGRRYQKAKKMVKADQLYPLSEAIKLLKKTSISTFNGTVEVHLNLQEAGLKTAFKFPFATGKTSQVAVASDALLKQISQGKIDFNLLISSPAMMPKLAKYAKILGPKGLMPNPKTGTISDQPEALAKKMSGQIQVQTEAKAPLMHVVIGKVNQPAGELAANFKALVAAVGVKNIAKAVLTSTMGPGIKVDYRLPLTKKEKKIK